MLVEDDDKVRFGVATALRARGFEVWEAASLARARALYANRPDVIITDLRLPDGDAVSRLPRLREIDATVPVYIITGFATIDLAVRAVKLGADEFFTKPVEMSKLLGCVEKAVSRRATTRSGQRRRATFEETGARSAVMRRLDAEIERLRDSDCTVLILGETGTGKSVLARRIHDLGARSNGPFVDVNCAGLSREFFESELFGHERGAFTGALTTKQGLFDAANTGTLFLDEIGDIDLQVQPKILKVLEERRYRRLGDVRERAADVRLIAATHHDLLEAVERKAFRADLFYRVSTVTLHVPSLRERREDIPSLIQHLLAQAGAPDVTLTREAWDKLTSYGWPGNIRELKNVVHRALLLREGDVVSENDVRFDTEPRPSTRQLTTQATSPDEASLRTLEEVEREHIARALASEQGRVAEAARKLGIPRSTLYQKLKTYGIALPTRTRVPAATPSSSGDE